MLFFDIPFFVLFAVVFPLNFILKGQLRITMLLLASYVFYGWWDWRFLSLLLISTWVDYSVALMLDRTESQVRRRLILTISIIANLGMLGYFKYANFFIDSFAAAFNIPPDQQLLLNIVLPPGISFYTFQTLSYTIDVYRRKAPPERNLLTFATFVAFFPQLVAGPIERPNKLIPQLHWDPRFNWANVYFGARLFILGCFKKLVIADNLGPISDAVFANPNAHTSLGLMIGAYCFALQIYCDFSGYSDMARGIAKMMGIDLSINFNLPYLSTSLNEFWRRWHITLSYWLRDYLYIPLGGSRRGFGKHIRNLLITFTASGLWHGAAWTFVLWGLLHGLYITVELLVSRFTRLTAPRWLRIALTFHVVVLLWVFFRAQSLMDVARFFRGLILPKHHGYFREIDFGNLAMLLFYASPLVAFSIWQYASKTLTPDLRLLSNRPLHGALLGIVAGLVILMGAQRAAQFIYFQF